MVTRVSALGRRRRPAVKQAVVLETLRRRIADGVYAPGARLPTWAELEGELGVSTVTLHRAMAELRRDGFIEPRGSQGTFVVERPPCLRHFGIVAPQAFAGSWESWSKFWLAFEQVAQTYVGDGGQQVTLYPGAEGRVDSPEFERLAEDVERQRVGGLLYAGPVAGGWPSSTCRATRTGRRTSTTSCAWPGPEGS